MTTSPTNDIIQTIRSSGHLADVIQDEIGIPAQVIKIAVELKSNNPFEILSRFNPFETFFCKDEIVFIFTNGYKTFKVALIATRNRPMIQFYLSYGEIGYLFSKIFRSIGLQFNRYGLSLNLLDKYADKSKKYDEGYLILSCNPSKICEFLEVDFETWSNGFKTNLDIFRWIMSSKYYNSGIFIKLKSNIRKRKKLSSFINQFLDFIEIKTAALNLNVQNHALAFFGIS